MNIMLTVMEALEDGLFRAQIDGFEVPVGDSVSCDTPTYGVTVYEVVEIESSDPPLVPPIDPYARRMITKVRVTRGKAMTPMLLRDKDGKRWVAKEWIAERQRHLRQQDAPPCPHCNGTGKQVTT